MDRGFIVLLLIVTVTGSRAARLARHRRDGAAAGDAPRNGDGALRDASLRQIRAWHLPVGRPSQMGDREAFTQHPAVVRRVIRDVEPRIDPRAIPAHPVSNGDNHETADRFRRIFRPRACRTRGRAAADRHQVQPRRGARHAERPGGQRVQATRRGAHEGPGESRGLPEQPALQGRRGTGRAAIGLRADAGARARQVRPGRHSGIRGIRSALHVSGPRRAAADL